MAIPILEKNLLLAEYGSITIRLGIGAVDEDFLGFELYETNSDFDDGVEETLVGHWEDENMEYYDFNLTRPTGIYYFNCYSIDRNFNKSVLGPTQKLILQISRFVDIEILDSKTAVVTHAFRQHLSESDLNEMYDDLDRDIVTMLLWFKGEPLS